MARIRVVRRGDDLFQVYHERASGKGKIVLGGRPVSREKLKEETGRVLSEAAQRDNPGQPA